MTRPTPEAARHYIENFAKYTIPGATYVEFPSGPIHFDNMTDEQAVKVAIGLMDIEAEAARRREAKSS